MDEEYLKWAGMLIQPMDPSALLRQTLLLDLEVSPQGKLLKAGAVLGDLVETPDPRDSATVLARLAQKALCVLGHNLVAHDLARLREWNPGHPLLSLPVIDTLILSPICFPENPYHRLVKDYKLVQESINDPVADARQAGVLFRDEIHALEGLRQADVSLFQVLHFLLATPGGGENPNSDRHAAGMEILFSSLGSVKPTRERVLELARELIKRGGCAAVPVEDTRLSTPELRLSLAFALTWLRVAGSNSVLPPWVRMGCPETVRLIERFREVPCTESSCAWCRRVHNPHTQIKTFFNYDSFRPIPRSPTGGSLQLEIVEAGMRNESLLAILPTGGGKSLCYQLPALVRNYRRGVLTIVISPLQALMKDQVDGLVRRTGTTSAAALYGLLTPPERGDVLRRVCLGDIAILYVSPEQLRNRSFRSAIGQREIGCWVIDEAHCLSKWGHDFRPDYLYVGRFIREFAAATGSPVPTIACFTATAKREVKEEILAHFLTETGRELRLFEGGVERDNLEFEVQSVPPHAKLERLHDLLSERLGGSGRGGAIIFHATRSATQGTAAALQARGWKAAYFHAGMTPVEKRRIQDEYLAGTIQVICATNAFGMGIDKEDVRLVIHADTPGSLESYIQEAGRAGRDGQRSQCVLLFDEADCEAQFKLSAYSELSRRDISQILRSLRKRAARGQREEIIITAGEILRDEEVENVGELNDRSADTKVRTAVAWLERSNFLQRDENRTSVFQARPAVRNIQEAEERIAGLHLSHPEQVLWLAILREILNADRSLSVDDLASLPEFANYARGQPTKTLSPELVSARVLKILGSMARVGLIKRDTLLNAFVRYKVADHSQLRLERVLHTERALIDVLALEAPDAEGWMALALRLLNQHLLDRGCSSSLEMLRDLLRSISEDGRGFAGSHGSIELRHCAQDTYRVRVRRRWTVIGELAEKRRRVAALALQVILAKIKPETPPAAELLVPFTLEEIERAVDQDLVLRTEVRDVEAAIARALLYLHEQHVIELQNGLAIFRSAMTIRLRAERKGDHYKSTDFQPLEEHYQERILQVHVMGEYARKGLQRIREAGGFVLAYFTLTRDEFLHRFFPNRLHLLTRATTSESYEGIVTSLRNREQIRIVTAPLQRNLLVLAGPGSGKTHAVVHRCAYLLRVERARPRSILVCCFNRSAAIQLRRRLYDLVGDDARGVMIQTYHGLAMRLLGYSAAARAGSSAPEINFDSLIRDAVQLLKAEKVPPGVEPDEVRDRLLDGFQHILVDEYQDIDAPQYEMISAIAGRTLKDADQKLSILAVGDDDQNIYSFRGTNVEFIRRFQEDYDAEVHYLVGNYRATGYLIDAANRVISHNADRMKTSHPIRISRDRAKLPPGGTFARLDPLTAGKVQVIRLPDAQAQAPAVLQELQRLHDLGIPDWSSIAVLARTHDDLARIRAAAEEAGIPIRWRAGCDALPAIQQIREIQSFLRALSTPANAPNGNGEPSPSPSVPLFVRATQLVELTRSLFPTDSGNPWIGFLRRQLEAWRAESDDAELPVSAAREFLYEACADSWREFDYGEGVLLSTVHASKGSEFDHVLLAGSWTLREDHSQRAQEDLRRLFYVGVTRAKHSLSVFDQSCGAPSIPGTLEGPAILIREFSSDYVASAKGIAYKALGLEDIHLSYPAFFPTHHRIHNSLAALQPGDRLHFARLKPDTDRQALALMDKHNQVVARLSRKSEPEWVHHLDAVREVRILAMVRRQAAQESDPRRRARFRTQEWEIPVVEVVTRLRA